MADLIGFIVCVAICAVCWRLIKADILDDGNFLAALIGGIIAGMISLIYVFAEGIPYLMAHLIIALS